jgi:heterodisulfide reductase subunit B
MSDLAQYEESAMALRKTCPANDIEVRERERAGCCSAGTSSPGSRHKTGSAARHSRNVSAVEPWTEPMRNCFLTVKPQSRGIVT